MEGSAPPAGDIIPTHAHAETHETFYVLEGQVRVFVQDRAGQKTSRLLGPGDFGFVAVGLTHAYRVEQAARMLGVLSGGFERFFQQMGTPADSGDPEQPPFIPDFPSPPAPRRSCCCTARPTGSSRACRVNGCTAQCGTRAAALSSGSIRLRTTCGRDHPGPRRRRCGRRSAPWRHGCCPAADGFQQRSVVLAVVVIGVVGLAGPPVTAGHQA